MISFPKEVAGSSPVARSIPEPSRATLIPSRLDDLIYDGKPTKLLAAQPSVKIISAVLCEGILPRSPLYRTERSCGTQMFESCPLRSFAMRESRLSVYYYHHHGSRSFRIFFLEIEHDPKPLPARSLKCTEDLA